MKKKTFNIKTKLVSAARKIWRYFPVRKEIYARNLVQKRVRTIDNVYKCELCSFKGVSSEFDVDHIDPVVDPKVGFVGWTEEDGFEGWDNYFNRLFITQDRGMLLCKPCHVSKTSEERNIRTISKRIIDKTNKNSVECKSNKNTKSIRKKHEATSVRRPRHKNTKR